MKTRTVFLFSLVATVVLSYGIAWLKLKGVRVGGLALGYLFAPLGVFLFLDAVWSLFWDDNYLVTRFCRIIIVTIFVTIHIQMLLSP